MIKIAIERREVKLFSVAHFAPVINELLGNPIFQQHRFVDAKEIHTKNIFWENFFNSFLHSVCDAITKAIEKTEAIECCSICSGVI